MKKFALVVSTFFIIATMAFALADPVNLVLNTTIAPHSTLTLFPETSPLVLEVTETGASKSVGYTFVGNELVDLTITSLHGELNTFRLKHDTAEATYMPYGILFDYDGAGPGGETSVTYGQSTALQDTDGVYDLTGTFTIQILPGNYAEGTYSDTVTFSITAR
jgi:hypothetical protein